MNFLSFVNMLKHEETQIQMHKVLNKSREFMTVIKIFLILANGVSINAIGLEMMQDVVEIHYAVSIDTRRKRDRLPSI